MDAVFGIGVGDCPLELAHDGFGSIHHQHPSGILVLGLGHLGTGIRQAHHPSAHLGHKRLRQLKHIAVNAIEAPCNGVAQLHVLFLVLTHGHIVRLVQQNIRCHQAGVSKKAAIDIVGIFSGLVLKLGHAAQLTEHGIAVQHPAQLRVLTDMALDKQGVLLRVKTAGNVLRQLLQRAAAQVSRVLANGDGVKVCHKIEAVILLAAFRPILNGSQIAAQGQITGGLNAGKHSLFFFDFFHCIHTSIQGYNHIAHSNIFPSKRQPEIMGHSGRISFYIRKN